MGLVKIQVHVATNSRVAVAIFIHHSQNRSFEKDWVDLDRVDRGLDDVFVDNTRLVYFVPELKGISELVSIMSQACSTTPKNTDSTGGRRISLLSGLMHPPLAINGNSNGNGSVAAAAPVSVAGRATTFCDRCGATNPPQKCSRFHIMSYAIERVNRQTEKNGGHKHMCDNLFVDCLVSEAVEQILATAGITTTVTPATVTPASVTPAARTLSDTAVRWHFVSLLATGPIKDPEVLEVIMDVYDKVSDLLFDERNDFEDLGGKRCLQCLQVRTRMECGSICALMYLLWGIANEHYEAVGYTLE